MIGLVRVQAPVGDRAGTILLGSLPAPPAEALAAVAVRCDREFELGTAIDWYGEILARRPAFALMVVADHRFGSILASCPHTVVRVIPPLDLRAGGLPLDALDELRGASVEGRVLDRLILRFGGVLAAEVPVVRCLIAHAVRGGTVSAAARDLGVSVDTVRRRMAPVGVRPGDLVRAARVLAYEERRSQGASARSALFACGWTDAEHLRRCRRRDDAAANRGD